MNPEETPAPPVFEGPRVYFATKETKFAAYLMSCIFIILGGTLLFRLHSWMKCVGAIPLLLGAQAALWTKRQKMVLFPNRIESHGLFRQIGLSREEILGLRVKTYKGNVTVWLIPKDPKKTSIQLDPAICDAVLGGWLDSLPNLDVIEAKQFTEELTRELQQTGVQLNTEAVIHQGRKISAGLSLAIFFLFFWTIFWPSLYNIYLALSLPICCLVLAFRNPGLYSFNTPDNSPQPDLAIPFMGAGFILAMSGMLNTHLLNYLAVIPASIGIAAVFTILRAKSDPRSRNLSDILLSWILLLPYGYGSSRILNTTLDRSAPQIFATDVRIKRIIGSGKHRHPEITLAPWGPDQLETSINVDWDFYHSLAQDDRVCVFLREGRFHFPWYVVTQCQQ